MEVQTEGKVSGSSKERLARYAEFAAAYAKARAAGVAAGTAVTPRPMVIGQAKSLFSNEIDYTKGPMYVCDEGVCGFAWVTIFPGGSSFAKWLIKNKYGRAAYGGGVQIWISAFNQSMTRKEACANAMAKVFVEELGVKAYAGSRLD